MNSLNPYLLALGLMCAVPGLLVGASIFFGKLMAHVSARYPAVDE